MVFKTWLYFSDNGSQVGTPSKHQFHHSRFIFSTVFSSFFIFVGLLHEYHTDVNKVTAVQSLYFLNKVFLYLNNPVWSFLRSHTDMAIH